MHKHEGIVPSLPPLLICVTVARSAKTAQLLMKAYGELSSPKDQG